MKNLEEIAPLAVAIIVAIALFVGFVTATKKAIKAPDNQDAIDSTMLLKGQKRHMRDVQDRQKQLMQDQRQRIKDLQRR